MSGAVRTPVLFIHGMWLHASSWQPWIQLFQEAGYAPIAPGWPGEARCVSRARELPELVANKGVDDLLAHYELIVKSLASEPILIGHSFGGLLAEKMLGRGLGRAAIAISPAQIKGVMTLPFAQLRAGFPALGNPLNKSRSVALTAEQFRYAFGNAISQEESDELFRKWSIPSPARGLFEVAFANFTIGAASKVDTHNSSRGPLLLISATADHTVPDVVTQSTFRQYRHSTSLTELVQLEGRGHSLTIDRNWRDVADTCLEWLQAQGLGAVQA
ncbi:MAG: alpha/beta hydrolase, partial [Alcaligenaceae bacterium]